MNRSGRSPAIGRGLWLCTGSAVLMIACGDPLLDPQRIQGLRVLGARVEVEGSPLEARPAPGEAATVRFWVVDPDGPALPSWALRVCVAEPTSYGAPICASPPFASAEQLLAGASEPTLDFQVPEGPELQGASHLAVWGVVCADGRPAIGEDLEASACSDGAGVRVSFDVTLRGDDGNVNPDLASARVSLDGLMLEELPATVPCSELPPVAAGSGEHQLELQLGESVRERLPGAGSSGVETLLVSQFSTLGLLDRRFSELLPETSDLRVSVPWEAPAEVVEPTVGWFFLVLRDHRGGAGFIGRAVCVVPR